MFATLQLSSLSYLTTAPPQHTCAAAPRAWSVARPPMCAKRTATLLGLSASAGLDEEPANASAKVLELASLWMYPVKSVRAVAVSTARLGPEGLDGDRRLLVASAANLALTQRQHPLLATVSATLEGNRLSLRAPGQPTLNETIPLEAGKPVTAALFGSAISLFDQGQAAAKWLTALLDTGRPSVLPLLGISAYKLLAAPARTLFALLPRPLTRALVCALALALSPSRRRPPTPVTRTRTPHPSPRAGAVGARGRAVGPGAAPDSVRGECRRSQRAPRRAQAAARGPGPVPPQPGAITPTISPISQI